VRTLARAVQHPGAVGTKLRLPWYNVNRQVTLSTKELVMVAGAPGGGKSTFLLNLVMQTEYPTLYLAQDSAPSVLARLSALGAGITTDRARDLMSTEGGREELGRTLTDVRPSLVVQDGAMTFEDIEQRVDALREWVGEAPPLVVLDNLIDTIVPGHQASDVGFYATIIPKLKQLAIAKDFAMIVLHHVVRRTETGKSAGMGTVGLRMPDLLYAGEREARHVWGIYNDGGHRMVMQILKQQDGPADPMGNMRVDLNWIPEMGKLSSR